MIAIKILFYFVYSDYGVFAMPKRFTNLCNEWKSDFIQNDWFNKRHNYIMESVPAKDKNTKCSAMSTKYMAANQYGSFVWHEGAG